MTNGGRGRIQKKKKLLRRKTRCFKEPQSLTVANKEVTLLGWVGGAYTRGGARLRWEEYDELLTDRKKNGMGGESKERLREIKETRKPGCRLQDHSKFWCG